MSERIREAPPRKADESLTEYIARLESFGATAGDQRIRIHPDYIDERGNLLVRPVVTYAVASDATVHPLLDTDGKTIVYGADSGGAPQPLVGTGGGQLLPDEDHVFTSVAATVATQAIVQPVSPKILYLYGIWVVQSATAAGRDWTPTITDGSTGMVMALTTNIASGATAQIWPRKEADTIGITYSPFPISNGGYLELVDTMAAAETATVWVSYLHRSSEL